MDEMPEYDVSFGGACGRRIDVVAGAEGIWRWRFRCGTQAIEPGGGLRLFCEVPRVWMATVLQTESPDRPGYVAASGSDGLRCEVTRAAPEWKDLTWATVALPDGMRQGQEVTVRFGSEAHPCHAVAHKYRYAPVSWRVDYEADGQYYRIWPPMVVRVVPAAAAKLNLVVPSVAAVGEPLLVRGRVEDANSNIGARCDAPIALELIDEAGRALAGRTLRVRADESGTFAFDDWRVDAPGVYRVRASAAGLPQAISNAAVVSSDPAARIAWGDCHNHTLWADGVGTIDDNFRYARDEAFLDVFAVSEHLNNNVEFDTFPQFKPGTDFSLLGPHMADATRRYQEAGRFVAINAAEYSPSFRTRRAKGDFCIFSPSGCFGDVPMARECADMLALAKRHGCICIPHVGGHILPWDIFPLDPDVTPLLEIAAMHGRFERFAQEGLQQGHRMGFVGMSDGHFGMPGYDNWSQHGRTPGLRHRNYSSQSAITGFVVDRLTREAVFEAMRSRRTYATTGQRIWLRFAVNGRPMGSEARTADKPRLEIEAHGTGPIALVEVIRGDRRALQEEGGGRLDIRIEWTDPAPPAGATWYYVRITQEDFSVAWSSPVWVEFAGKGGASAEDAAALSAWDDPPYWPPHRPETCDPAHTRRLESILAKRGIADRFRQIRQVGVFAEPRGRFAYFLARDAERGDKLVQVHLFIDFADDRLYIADGEAPYGRTYKWE
jgi:hypothetical protein